MVKDCSSETCCLQRGRRCVSGALKAIFPNYSHYNILWRNSSFHTFVSRSSQVRFTFVSHDMGWDSSGEVMLARRHVGWIFIVLLASLCRVGFADNWPAWRGPTNDGISTEKNLPVKWSASE